MKLLWLKQVHKDADSYWEALHPRWGWLYFMRTENKSGDNYEYLNEVSGSEWQTDSLFQE